MTLTRAYEEVIDFIAAGTSPDNIASFRPSAAAKRRVAALIEREKTTGLTPDETSELAHYLQLEHLMRPARSAPGDIFPSSSRSSGLEHHSEGVCEVIGRGSLSPITTPEEPPVKTRRPYPTDLSDEELDEVLDAREMTGD